MYKFKITSLPFNKHLLDSIGITHEYYYADKFPKGQFISHLNEFIKLDIHTFVKLNNTKIDEILKLISKDSFVYGASTPAKLQEARRATIIKHSKEVVGSKSRYETRVTIRDSEISYSFDVMALLRSKLLRFKFTIRSYVITLEIDGVMKYLKSKLTKRKKFIYTDIRKFINEAIDKKNIRVDCTCPDFKYRMAYVATKQNFKAGTPEIRPAKVTNPKNRGGICKHIAKILGNKKWVQKYVSLINLLVKLYPDLLK